MVITYQKFNRFSGKWVAIDPKTQGVLCAGNTIDAVQKKAEKEQSAHPDLFLQYILPFNSHIAPMSQ